MQTLKRLRRKNNMTQAQLAETMGYSSQSIIAMWESGERKPPSDKLPELAKILGCTIDELFIEKGAGKNE